MATILIIDDHPALRLVLKTQLLNVLGVTQIEEADNGHTAIEVVQRVPPDLVILDLVLPKLDGLTLIARLKQLHPNVRILVLSGQDTAVYAARAKGLGANGFISKTQSMEEIIRGAEMVLAGYQLFPDDNNADSKLPQSMGADEERLRHLTDKEILILQLLVKGMSNKSIGETLFISNKTVSTHKMSIMKKLNIHSLVELVDFARRHQVTG